MTAEGLNPVYSDVTSIGRCMVSNGIVRVKQLEADSRHPQPLQMENAFRYFNSSPEVIRLTVMIYVRYPLSLRQVEDLLLERGIDNCHETVRFC